MSDNVSPENANAASTAASSTASAAGNVLVAAEAAAVFAASSTDGPRPPIPKLKPVDAADASYIVRIAAETKIPVKGIMATAQLLSDGGTVPFIARYRKEATGELDEVQIATIRDRLEQLRELDARRAAILKSLEENKHLTPELKKAVETADTLARLEDIYAPFRPKRRTRATVAKERGLEPLADFLLDNITAGADVLASEVAKFIKPAAADADDAAKELAVPDAAAALAGARDIIAERVSDDATARAACRELYEKEATLKSDVIKGRETEGAKFKDYFKWEEPLNEAPSHRILAIRRGEKEGFLFFRITVPEDAAHAILERQFIKPGIQILADAAGAPLNAAAHVREAIRDSWKRLLSPSLETEARMSSKKRADEVAIHVFADNVGKLLLAPALGQKNTLALDPGFRTGCKLAVLDAHGKLLHDAVINPTTGSKEEIEAAGTTLLVLCHQYKIQAVAIGNGTAGRETEAFVRDVFSKVPDSAKDQLPFVVSVNESGASIYSGSPMAREEFPDKDITLRGAVSIGRRLQDPLAELVKIDPQSIGVGQYQHDVDQVALKKSLDDVVISCVNRVGVELNSASYKLLSYVAGLSIGIAKNIVAWRDENGAFKSREDLKKVKGLGPKAFEQCAGFLRIREAANPLDASGVHPERYTLVEKMAADVGEDVSALIRDAKARLKIELEKYVDEESKVGLPTLKDILNELEKPGRDPREKFEVFKFDDKVHEIKDLAEGMRLPGIITNVTAFGAFVDIGVHQDGLLHLSQISDDYIKDPAEKLQVGQKVRVTVLEVDIPRKRIALSMRSNPVKQVKGAGETFDSDRDRQAGRDGRGGRGGDRRSGFGGGAGSGENSSDSRCYKRTLRDRDDRWNRNDRNNRGTDGRPRSWTSSPSTSDNSFNNPFADLGDLLSSKKKK